MGDGAHLSFRRTQVHVASAWDLDAGTTVEPDLRR
jgi:hypothetical protein